MGSKKKKDAGKKSSDTAGPKKKNRGSRNTTVSESSNTEKEEKVLESPKAAEFSNDDTTEDKSTNGTPLDAATKRKLRAAAAGRSKSLSNTLIASMVLILLGFFGGLYLMIYSPTSPMEMLTEVIESAHLMILDFLDMQEEPIEAMVHGEGSSIDEPVEDILAEPDDAEEEEEEEEPELRVKRERIDLEEEERKNAQKEAKRRRLEREEEQRKKQKEEEQRKKEEEEQQIKEKEEEQQQKKEKEEEQRKKEEEEQQNKEKEEALKKKEREEEQRKKEEEEQQQKEMEEALKKKEMEEEQKKKEKEEEQRKKEEEEQKKKEKEEEQRKKEEEELKKKEIEEELRNKGNEEELIKKEREEEELRKKEREEEQRKKEKEEEKKKKEKEEEQKKKQEEEELRKKEKEAELRRKEKEAEQKKKEREEEMRKKEREEELRRKEKEEEQKKKQREEEEELRRKEKEEQKKKQQEEELKKKAQEEELRRKEKEEELKKKEQEEELKKKEKEEEQSKKEKEEQQAKEQIKEQVKEPAKEENMKVDARLTYEKADITTDADYVIRMALDEADSWLDANKPVEALDLFNKILKNHPKSPRALYGRARSLDLRAELERSNPVLEESINAYHEILFTDEAPKALVMKAGKQLAARQTFRGWAMRAVKTVKRLIEKYPEDISLWNDLGVKYMMSNNYDEAELAFKKVLDINPNDGLALVHLGFIIKFRGDDAGSIDFLRRGIATREEGTIDSRFFLYLGDALYRTGKHNESYNVYEEGAKLGLFLSTYQRSLYNVDFLAARPVWTPEQTMQEKQLMHIKENWETIRDEGLAQLDPGTGSFSPEEENLREKGEWKQFTLFARGQKNVENCKKVPKTCALFDNFPVATGCTRGQIKYSVMHPGVHVWPHCGPTNCRIRAHLGLVVPPGPRLRVADQEKSWKEGELLIFDDSFEHEVWHEGNATRLVLIMDLWHPDLTNRQRQSLSPI